MKTPFSNAFSNYVQRVPTSVTISVGLLLVGYHHWVNPLSTQVQLILCAVLMLVVGIPHGALDHLIVKERNNRRQKPFSLVHFIAGYVLQMALYGAFWWISPGWSLVFFLLISASHFGETDLENAPDDHRWLTTRFLAGGWVLAFLLLTHASETTLILNHLVGTGGTFVVRWQWAVAHALPLLLGWALLTGLCFGLAMQRRPLPVNAWRLVRLGLVMLTSTFLPLLLAFMLYFAGWHALSSFGAIRSYLRRPPSSFRAVWNLWRLALPLTLMAFGFLGTAAVVWYRVVPDFDLIPGLFVLVSLITLPHSQVMHLVNTGPKQPRS